MTLYPKLIMDALAKVRYPGTGKDLVTMGMVEDNIRIDGNKVSFSLLFEKPNDPFIKSVVKAAETAILTYIGEEVEIKGNITVEAKQAARPEPDKLLPEVKNIICRIFRQGRCRQKYGSCQLGGGAGSARLQGRFAGCRHLRPFSAQDVQCRRSPSLYGGSG